MASVSGSLQSRYDVETLEVVLGELLSNVVQHAAGFTDVAIDVRPDRIELAVSDAGRGFRLGCQTQMPAAQSEHGRGLAIVRAFAGAVSVRPAGGRGARVLVTLPLRASSSLTGRSTAD